MAQIGRWSLAGFGVLFGLAFGVAICWLLNPGVEQHLPSGKELQMALGMTLIAILLALAGSYWKRFGQRSYGLAEVSFGVALFFALLIGRKGGLFFDPARMLGMASAVVVISR